MQADGTRDFVTFARFSVNFSFMNGINFRRGHYNSGAGGIDVNWTNYCLERDAARRHLNFFAVDSGTKQSDTSIVKRE